jgi:glutathione synthase/RimK-type ligase-like ATP-grasp enzyme
MGARHWPEDADEAYEDVCNELKEANQRIAELAANIDSYKSIISHGIDLLDGNRKDNVIEFNGVHAFECSYLIAQISQLVEYEEALRDNETVK